jgi:hypothetical protein
MPRKSVIDPTEAGDRPQRSLLTTLRESVPTTRKPLTHRPETAVRPLEGGAHPGEVTDRPSEVSFHEPEVTFHPLEVGARPPEATGRPSEVTVSPAEGGAR